MTALLLIAVYLAGWAVCTRKVHAYLIDDSAASGIDSSDMRVADAVLAMLIGTVWPLALPVSMLMRQRTPTMRARELDERERRIAAYERDLGMALSDPNAPDPDPWRIRRIQGRQP